MRGLRSRCGLSSSRPSTKPCTSATSKHWILKPRPSLEALLLDGASYSIFDTWVVDVRADGQLIAAGIFDQGTRSLAGIVNFYDPDFRKYSLGKYLMLCKLNYAQRQNLAYYYPGYLVARLPQV